MSDIRLFTSSHDKSVIKPSTAYVSGRRRRSASGSAGPAGPDVEIVHKRAYVGQS